MNIRSDTFRIGAGCLLATLAALPAAALADPPSAETGKWNKPTTKGTDNQGRNNCYNHATNVQNGKFAQPGRGGGFRDPFPLSRSEMYRRQCGSPPSLIYKGPAPTLDKYEKWVTDGAVKDGLRKLSDPGGARPGECVVALVIGYVPVTRVIEYPSGQVCIIFRIDYHWIRRNADRTWSHKPGAAPVRTTDDSGQPITDPKNLITPDESKSRYDRFSGYFAYTPGAISVNFGGDELVDLPPGQARALSRSFSGHLAGWTIDAPEAADIVRDYLTGVPPTPARPAQWELGRDGWILEAGYGGLGENPGVWGPDDEVRLEVRDGAVRALVSSPGADVKEFWFEDWGLEYLLESQAEDRMELNPGVVNVCYADCNEDAQLDFFDFLCFQNAFGAGDPAADCDGDGTLSFFDFLCFQNEFAAGCP